MVDLSYLRKKQEEINNPSSAKNTEFLDSFLQLDVGDNDVRILPAEDEEESFFVETKIHRVPNGQYTKNIHCLKVFGKACPICDLYFDLWKEHNAIVGKNKKQDTKFSLAARPLRAGERYYMNVLSRASSEVKILSVGKKLMDKIIGDILTIDADESVFMLDTQKGYDYKIKKSMLGEYPDYSQSSAARKASAVANSPTAIKAALSARHDLKALLREETYETVKTIADEIRTTIYGSSLPVENGSTPMNSELLKAQNEYLRQLEEGDDDA